jgi:hypothetical protein
MLKKTDRYKFRDIPMKLHKVNSAFIFFTLMLPTLFLTVGSIAVLTESPEVEDYRGIEYCLDCHSEQTVGWLRSPHSKAYKNPEFQEEWQELGSPEDCLSCHTTGFEEDGTFMYKGVTCEACHGPGDTMNRDVSSELCGSCHSGPFPTYEEWKKSGPSHLNATCIQCHDEHTARLSAETSTGTCASCHSSHIELVAETKHGVNDVECVDCHMHRTPIDFKNGIPANTGHEFYMNVDELDCQTCHERPLDKHDTLGENAFACLSCHGEIHGLGLKLVNGTVYAPDDPVALCAQCHNERYTAWAQGTHGTPEDPEAPCTECHDPHDPVISGIPTLSPVPPRTPAGGPSLLPSMAFVVTVMSLGFAVIILRWRANV